MKILKKLIGLLVLIIVYIDSNSQCILNTNIDTEAEVISCLSSCGCTEIIIPTGVTVSMAGDWDLVSQGAVLFTIQGSGSLVFSGAGGNRDELFLASGSVLIIEDVNNINALASSPPSGGNTRVEIGSQVYQGNDFQNIIAAGGADENGPLPITLTYFSATPSNNSVLLKWQTSEEINNDYFNLERSLDGLNYEFIGNVKGAGNSSAIIDYGFHDINPHFGLSYYRLSQTDFDGTSESFRPVSVFVTMKKVHELIITPNPAKSGDLLNMITDIDPQEELLLTVYNNQGEIIESALFSGMESSFTPSKKIPPGLYIVTLSVDNIQKRTKLLIQ